jgi:hypothetical protein
MASAEVHVKIADLPVMKEFIGSAGALLAAVDEAADLPTSVLAAADRLRRAVAGLGHAPGNPVVTSDDDESRIRDAMAEAQEHPGRIVTR